MPICPLIVLPPFVLPYKEACFFQNISFDPHPYPIPGGAWGRNPVLREVRWLVQGNPVNQWRDLAALGSSESSLCLQEPSRPQDPALQGGRAGA